MVAFYHSTGLLRSAAEAVGLMRQTAAVVAFLVAVSMAMAAAAQERKAGDRIAYDFTLGGQGGAMGAGMNANMRLTLLIERIDQDGSAHGKLSIESQMLPANADVAPDATISPTGALLTKYDPNLRVRNTMSNEDVAALSSNAAAQMLQTELSMSNFNTFADACGQRALHVGDSWDATSMTPPVTLHYTVTGREQKLGHDAFVVSIQSAPNPLGSISGRGYYDAASHTVVALHSEMHSSAQNQTGTVDVTLRP